MRENQIHVSSPLSLVVNTLISFILVHGSHNAEQIPKLYNFSITFSALRIVKGDVPFLLKIPVL